MRKLRILKGSKEQFVKEISNEIASPLDALLHDLRYVEWNSETYNTYKVEEFLIDIEDCEETTKTYYKLKQALSEFEDITGVKFTVHPRLGNSIYNTIMENKNEK